MQPELGGTAQRPPAVLFLVVAMDEDGNHWLSGPASGQTEPRERASQLPAVTFSSGGVQRRWQPVIIVPNDAGVTGTTSK
jgi:hypothetical protein